MTVTDLRPDIAAARARAKFSLGSGRELRRLETLLSHDEAVAAMAQCRYQGCFGLAVLTDSRFLFLCNGVIWRVNEDLGLDRIAHVQWRTVFGIGTLTLHVGPVPLEFTGVSGPGGAAVVQGLRQSMAGRDRLDRQVREGILTLAADFAPPGPAAVLDSFPDEVPEAYFLTGSVLPET